MFQASRDSWWSTAATASSEETQSVSGPDPRPLTTATSGRLSSRTFGSGRERPSATADRAILEFVTGAENRS